MVVGGCFGLPHDIRMIEAAQQLDLHAARLPLCLGMVCVCGWEVGGHWVVVWCGGLWCVVEAGGRPFRGIFLILITLTHRSLRSIRCRIK